MKKVIVAYLLFILSAIGVFGQAEQTANADITAAFTPSTDYAEIGQPFEIQYELSGGSGEFPEVTLQALFPLGSGTSYGGFSEKTNQKEGSCTIVPEEGKTLSVQIHGYDSAGKQFYIDMGYEIPIMPNPDLPVTVEFDKASIAAGEEITASYHIQGCSAFSGTASWTIGEKGEYWDEYSQKLGEQAITDSSGTISFTPAFGDYVYLVLTGCDEEGKPVYIESKAVSIDSQGYEEIAVAFTPSTDYAEIGQPFEIQYELSGGSGEFPEVTVQALFPLGSGTSYGGYSEKTNQKEGRCTIIPEEGKTLSVQIHGYDSAGKQFYIDMGYEIPIMPNPDLPVTVEFDKASIAAGEEITASYHIQGCSAFSGTASWTIGEKSEYWDEYSQKLGEQAITDSSGTISFTPSMGDYLYLVLCGYDEKHRPVYIESNPVSLNIDPPAHEIIMLPAELTEIGSKAFAGIAAKGVVIPPSVLYIADDAFANSSITTIYGTTDYAMIYASEHGFVFRTPD